jgi:predicted O-methyltransferase YrrM
MDALVTKVLREYDERMAREHELARSLGEADFDRRKNEFLLPIGAAAGQFLNMLIKSANSQCIIEVGTSFGYSTIWLAEAARATGGKVVSLELAEAKVDYARKRLRQAGLSSYVEFKIGDALESIAALDEPIDFVLIDLWKDLYVPVLEALYPRLRSGALLAADNIVEPPSSAVVAALYVAAVKLKLGVESVTVPIGNGIELSRYTQPMRA